MSGDNHFAKDLRINFRVSPFKKKQIKARAKELGMTASKYIISLIDDDLTKNKRDGVINKHNPF